MKRILKPFAIMILVCNSGVLVWTFLSAYFSRGYSVLVSINNYNEANWELWGILPITIISMIICTKIVYHEIKNY